MELELLAHKTGEVYLAHYDSINGKDRLFRLSEGGTVDEVDFDADDQATYRLVDLVTELRAMATSAREHA